MEERLAHLSKIGEDIRQQTVYQHCLNTAEYTKIIHDLPDLEAITYLAALLHDVGKATDAFSEYLRKAVFENKKDKKTNHSSAGAKFLLNFFEINPTSDAMLLITIVCEAIISHHGLCDFIKLDGENQFDKRCNPSHDIAYEQVLSYIESHFNKDEIRVLFDRAQTGLLTIKKEIMYQTKNDADKKTECKFFLSALSRHVLSIVIDADREDTRSFMLNTPLRNSNDPLCWDDAIGKLEAELAGYKAVEKLDVLRKTISEECRKKAAFQQGIYRLSCPTGSGKTLSSLRYALHHAKEYKKKHLFYIAPYKTILEQNAKVIKQFFPDEMLLEHHSDMIPEDVEEYAYLNSNWSSPVIMTTAIQFYQTLFSDRTTSIRRFHQLANSVIIIDEAQTIPINIVHMFNYMLNYLAGICHTTIVLCTATQPVFDKVTRPLHFVEYPELVDHRNAIQDEFKRVHVVNACIPEGFDLNEFTEFIMNCKEKHQSVLVIVNTKSEAASLYKLCVELNEYADEQSLIYHLTTSMCPEHRNDILAELKGKLSNCDGKGILCIATNLVECGVDMSFHCVIRSLAGLDSIIQAAGRCNRNKEIDDGYVYLVKSKTENITSLPMLKKGQTVIQKILLELDKQNDYLDELFHTEVIEKYYDAYFFDHKDEMDYLIKKHNTNQIELWTGREASILEAMKTDHHSMPRIHSALKTAGENFELIEPSIGMIVPYGEGKKLIEDLNSSIEANEKYDLLKKAQRFTIQMYERKYKELVARGIVSIIEFCGIAVLKEGFYNNAIGLDITSELALLAV